MCDPSGRRPSIPGGDGEAAGPRTERVCDIEGGMVEGGCKRLRICGDVHQPGLQSRNDGESRPDQQYVDHGKPGMASREDQETEHGCVPHEKATDCGQQGAISQP